MKRSTETVIQPFADVAKGVKTGSVAREEKTNVITPEEKTRIITPAPKGVEHI